MECSTSLKACGILNLCKPTSRTSRELVDQVSRLLSRGGKRKHAPKVGHAGTLDPLATGVLVVCVGQATRLIETVQEMPKTYRAKIRLGARSETLDVDCPLIVETESPSIPTLYDIQEALGTQVGDILQIPPQYSAIRVQGRRAYDIARSGGQTDLPPRPVRVDDIRLITYEWPWLVLDIDCGGGTYIRSIARDVGEQLGCGGLIQELERTRIGCFRIEEAVDPDSLTIESVIAKLLPMTAAVGALPQIRLDAVQVGEIRRGRCLSGLVLQDSGPGALALIGPGGDLVALAERKGDGWVQPRRVFEAESDGFAE